MKTSFSKLRAFTLIELLVVIAIIGILTGIVLTGLQTPKAKARDAKRISDLGQIQLALELYFDRCKEYPPSPLDTASVCPNAPVTLGTYIAVIPTAPGGTAYTYTVVGSPTRNDFVLHAILEYSNEVIKDALPSNAIDSTCSNVPANLHYCLGPK